MKNGRTFLPYVWNGELSSFKLHLNSASWCCYIWAGI